jgi:hypothetical protein
VEDESERHTNEGDHNEVSIPGDTFKYVELVIEPPAINRVEDLSEDEGVKHECRHNRVALISVIVTKDLVAEEVEDEDDDDLVY